MNNKLNVSLSNPNNQLVGNIQGKNEINVNITSTGARGKEGLSAYEVWLSEGNEGSIDDFFRDIQGDNLHVDNITTTEEKQFISFSEKLKISGYVHDQISSSKIWIVDHILDKFPSVSVVDTGGNLVMGEVEYINTNQLKISFSHEFSGKAYLN